MLFEVPAPEESHPPPGFKIFSAPPRPADSAALISALQSRISSCRGNVRPPSFDALRKYFAIAALTSGGAAVRVVMRKTALGLSLLPDRNV